MTFKLGLDSMISLEIGVMRTIMASRLVFLKVCQNILWLKAASIDDGMAGIL